MGGEWGDLLLDNLMFTVDNGHDNRSVVGRMEYVVEVESELEKEPRRERQSEIVPD